jgi:hypothetical protein
MNISAANLVKSSLKQLAYLEYVKKPKTVTQNMIDGNNYAIDISQGMIVEKRGTIKTNDFNLYFSIDAIHNDIAIEIKQVNRPDDNWFFTSSLIQSGLYNTLLSEVKFLDTPVFMVQQGHKYEVLDLKNNPLRYFILMYGNQKWIVGKSNLIMAHFLIKAQELSRLVDKKDFTYAMEYASKWDAEYKFKEEYLLNSLYYKCITKNSNHV